MKSPCRDCDLVAQDKNNDTCRDCRKRIKYINYLSGLPEGFYMETETDLSQYDLKEMEELAELPAKADPEPPARFCTTPGCGGKYYSKGLCEKCYSRIRKQKDKIKKLQKRAADIPQDPKPVKEKNPLLIDLSKVPTTSSDLSAIEILRAIGTIGEREFRPLEFQVMKILVDYVDKYRPSICLTNPPIFDDNKI